MHVFGEVFFLPKIEILEHFDGSGSPLCPTWRPDKKDAVRQNLEPI